MRVGEKSSASLESNLEGLSSVLEADLSTYKAKILKILAECTIKLPDKCTIYTTLIGLLNTKNYNFGGECVELLIRNLKGIFLFWQNKIRSNMATCHKYSLDGQKVTILIFLDSSRFPLTLAGSSYYCCNLRQLPLNSSRFSYNLGRFLTEPANFISCGTCQSKIVTFGRLRGCNC